MNQFNDTTKYLLLEKLTLQRWSTDQLKVWRNADSTLQLRHCISTNEWQIVLDLPFCQVYTPCQASEDAAREILKKTLLSTQEDIAKILARIYVNNNV